MKLNKKYIPSSPQPKKNLTPDAYFPIILPAYKKQEGAQISELLVSSVQWSTHAASSGKSLQPLVVRNVVSHWMADVLKGKSQLPLAAKLQRLATFQKKLHLKEKSLISQLFALSGQAKESFFNLRSAPVQAFLQLLSEKGLIKRKEQLVYRDVSTKTIVAPDEIEWREEKQLQLEVKCFVEAKHEVFPLVVDDPMLLFSDLGVVVHANDKRYKKHIGKKIIIPVINTSIPVFGEDGMDTIKDNGIQRLNPLLSQQILEKTRAFWLETTEEYIDENGCFNPKVPNFWGKSVFEFTGNIVETLATIGNLNSQQEILQQVPYSRETGQRLIKRVLPVMVLDFSVLQEEFFRFLEGKEAFIQSLFQPEDTLEFLIETRNPYAPKLSFLLESSQVKLLSLSSYSDAFPTVLSLVIADQLLKGQLPEEFTQDELLDMLFLLPESEREDLRDQHTHFSDEQIKKFIASLKTTDSEVLLEELRVALDQCLRLERKSDRFLFQPSKLLGTDQRTVISCSETFLQALLLITMEENLVLNLQAFSPQLKKLLILFSFLKGAFPQLIDLPQQTGALAQIPSFFHKLADHYGRETLRMSLLQYGSYDEPSLEKSLDYLKHLRNLFKVLYEEGAFGHAPRNQLNGKDFWLLSECCEITDQFAENPEDLMQITDLLPKIQGFTREELTRHLALNKEKDASDVHVFSAQIFLALLFILEPVIPEFICRVEQVLGDLHLQLLKKSDYQAQKDYKIHLLFDILKGVHQKRVELDLKKHLPIELAIQANSDILHLLESHEASLKALFKIEKMHYLAANEHFPSDFHTFMILDITVGIKSCEFSSQQDEQLLREKELKEKLQSLEYIRSTLMALSLNPLTDPQKIEDKEAELETIKTEIQHLEIKIQKAKMEKRS